MISAANAPPGFPPLPPGKKVHGPFIKLPDGRFVPVNGPPPPPIQSYPVYPT